MLYQLFHTAAPNLVIYVPQLSCPHARPSARCTAAAPCTRAHSNVKVPNTSPQLVRTARPRSPVPSLCVRHSERQTQGRKAARNGGCGWGVGDPSGRRSVASPKPAQNRCPLTSCPMHHEVYAFHACCKHPRPKTAHVNTAFASAGLQVLCRSQAKHIAPWTTRAAVPWQSFASCTLRLHPAPHLQHTCCSPVWLRILPTPRSLQPHK